MPYTGLHILMQKIHCTILCKSFTRKQLPLF